MNNGKNRYSNLYDRNGKLLRKAPLKPYSIKELEELLENWPEGIEYRKARIYATNLLIQMYQNPKTEEDKAYVKKAQEELLTKLQAKSTEEEKVEKLEELKTVVEEKNDE